MKYPELAEKIVQLVHAEGYRPVKPKAFLHLLDLDDDDYPAVRRTVKDLSRSGQIKYAGNHLVMPADASAGDRNTINGTFRPTRSGYGFVRPSPAHREISEDDIFIPEFAKMSALEGDLVEVRVRNGREGKLEGEIRKILERARRQFSGSFTLQNGEPSVWLDGVQIDHPVEVGDVRGLPVSEGDKVIVELVEFPDEMQPGEGVIMEVLGSSKNPAVDTVAIMFQYGLVEEFPEEAIDQARQAADAFDEESIPSGRRDLRSVPTLTIDPYNARDFDDAISLSVNSAGHYELLVHIADVSSFVPEGGPLDIEARRRATSVYLPDKVVPMIPEIISNHLASLQPDKNRFAKTVWIEFTPDGQFVNSEVYNSVIRNQQRLNYEQVDQFLENPAAWRKRLTPEIFELLSHMHTLAMILRKRRQMGGSLELTLPEIKIDLDKIGKVKGAHLSEHTESHQIIEEFMLAGNQAVATWLDQLQLPFLRRAHAPPARRKLKKLTQFVRGLGIECESLENRFEVQRVVAEVNNSPLEYAVNYAILKSMSKAVYQPDEERHFALDMTHYCHFTSPIRRYPDLVVHRIVQKIIDGENAKEPIPKLIQLGEHCSDREQNAESAERELTHIKLLHYMKKQIGEEKQVVIVAVRANAVVVRGKEVPAEGVIRMESLPEDRYRFDKQAYVLEGYRKGNTFRLGDELTVRVHSVDFAQRDLLFDYVEHLYRRPKTAISQSDSTERQQSRRGGRDSRGKKQLAKSRRGNLKHSSDRRRQKNDGDNKPPTRHSSERNRTASTGRSSSARGSISSKSKPKKQPTKRSTGKPSGPKRQSPLRKKHEG